MSRNNFISLLEKELKRIDEAKVAKRNEKIIDGFTKEGSPKAILKGKKYYIFNSNDYLGLRHHRSLKREETKAGEKFGSGPGAVRFISGTLKVHKDLEKEIAKFSHKEDAIVYSSAFAANLAAISCLISGQNKDSLLTDKVAVISDELNHRSIIDGIRISKVDKENRFIFPHLSIVGLEDLLKSLVGKVDRIVVITDGVFSMLGEYQKLLDMRKVIDRYDKKYPNGILLLVDDSHGVGACGVSGRGIEDVESTSSDVLVGTFGKAFGADGGYVAGSKTIIDYLRESSATYIYSNSIPPGTAGAALEAVRIIKSKEGKKMLQRSRDNISYFKKECAKKGFLFAADSSHPIQPLLIGDPVKTKALVEYLYGRKILVTNINYPVVPKGRDEIRIQISSVHTKKDMDYLILALEKGLKKLSR